jgi:hypothetical protein
LEILPFFIDIILTPIRVVVVENFRLSQHLMQPAFLPNVHPNMRRELDDKDENLSPLILGFFCTYCNSDLRRKKILNLSSEEPR